MINYLKTNHMFVRNVGNIVQNLSEFFLNKITCILKKPIQKVIISKLVRTL